MADPQAPPAAHEQAAAGFAHPPIACPFVYANGRRCTGFIRRARAYGPTDRHGRIIRHKVRKYRLWCTDKDNHAGILTSFEGKQRMEFYPDQLAPGVEDRLWDEDLLS